jgi:hypothetical protein
MLPKGWGGERLPGVLAGEKATDFGPARIQRVTDIVTTSAVHAVHMYSRDILAFCLADGGPCDEEGETQAAQGKYIRRRADLVVLPDHLGRAPADG